MKKFEHFKSNLKVLVTAENEDLSNEFIVGGIIDKFFVQFELGWKVLKELLSYNLLLINHKTLFCPLSILFVFFLMKSFNNIRNIVFLNRLTFII